MRHFLALALACTVPVLAVAADASLDPSRVQWTRLEFVAKKFFISARTEVSMDLVPASEAASHWVRSEEEEGLRPASEELVRITIGSFVLGKEDWDTLWHDPRDLTAFGRFKERRGKKAYQKRARFGRGGVFVLRQAPIDGTEREKPSDGWTKVEKFFYPRPVGSACRVVTESSALFYLVSAVELDAGESREVCIFSGKKGTFPVRMEAGKLERLEVAYLERRPGQQAAERKGVVDVRRITVRPVGGEDGEELELLGLEGEITLFLEETSRIPVRLEGSLSGVGHVAVRLTAVDLRPPSPRGNEGGAD